MLKMYHNPNRNPSCNVFAKLLDFSLSPALSAAVALTSKRSGLESEGTEFQALSGKAEEEERDHDRFGKQGSETALLETERSCGLVAEKEEETRIGSNLGLEPNLRGFREGIEHGEDKEMAVLCIVFDRRFSLMRDLSKSEEPMRKSSLEMK